MIGIDKVQEYLGEYKTNYVIIGGTAAIAKRLGVAEVTMEEFVAKISRTFGL